MVLMTTFHTTKYACSSRLAIAGVWLALSLSLLGCQSKPERPADLIISDAHGGGSVLATSPDSTLVASGGWAGRIRLWRLESGQRYAGWNAHKGNVTGLIFLRAQPGQTQRLLSSGYDGRIAIWSATGRLLSEWQTLSPITALTATPDQSLFISGHKDGSVRAWNPDGESVAAWTNLHGDYVRALASDGERLASSGGDGAVFAWRVDTPPLRLDAPPSDARTLLFSDDGSNLLGAGWFRLFRWHLSDGHLDTIATEHQGIINDLAYLNDGRLASISRQTDSAVLILEAGSGRTLERLQQHDLCGTSVSPSPDGRYLTTSSDDASVRIWQLPPAGAAH